MIIIYTKNGGPKVIRPCPLINISFSASSNANISVGGVYNITLSGTIIAHAGSPNDASVLTRYNPKPTEQAVDTEERLGNILKKQKYIKEILDDVDFIEVLSISGNEPVIKFYPRVVSISFDEGLWIDTCNYSIALEADLLLDNSNKIIANNHYGHDMFGINVQNLTPDAYINTYGGFISDFSENWSLEPEDGNADIPDNTNQPKTFRTYILTRTISATGKRMNGISVTKRPAHIHAKNFIDKYLIRLANGEQGYKDYLKYGDNDFGNSSLEANFGKKFLDLAQTNFKGYNHSRTESFDVYTGSYTLNDRWILAKNNCYENYTASFSNSSEDGIRSLTIEGTIKGLTEESAKSPLYGGTTGNANQTAYKNAVDKYNRISANGTFGVGCDIYKRATALMNGLDLNPTPYSFSLGFNELAGELTYSVEYNNRPIVSDIDGVTATSVSINDTYPGDLFAIIPVLGRVTGPVMQYLDTRTEYRRDLSLEFTIDMQRYFGIGTTPMPTATDPYSATTTSTTTSTTLTPGTARTKFLLSKPTLWEPARSEISNIIRGASPAFEPGIRKYFLNPPVETWNPLDGKYTLSMSWVYELNS